MSEWVPDQYIDGVINSTLLLIERGEPTRTDSRQVLVSNR